MLISKQDTRMAEQGSSEAETGSTWEVVRDSTFARFVADEGIISEMGRELEVAFLQYGPLLTTQTDLGNAQRTEFKSVVTEVARMRMGQNEFLSVVMAFLRSGILEGRLKGDAIQSSVAEWTNAVAEEREASEDESR